MFVCSSGLCGYGYRNSLLHLILLLDLFMIFGSIKDTGFVCENCRQQTSTEIETNLPCKLKNPVRSVIIVTEAMPRVKFSSWIFRVVMMTINNVSLVNE